MDGRDSSNPKRRRNRGDDDDDLTAAACTGKSCRSCTAEAIADCVAVCCCPCAVVNLFTLTFFRLPWAVARRWLGRKKKQQGRCSGGAGGGDMDGIWGKGRVEEGTLEIVGGEGNDEFGAEFKVEQVWVEVGGHMGFGRVSFKGN